MNLVTLGCKSGVTLYDMNKIHLVDGETLGRMLNPDSKDYAKYIRKLYERNKGCFTERDTVLLKVDVDHLHIDLARQYDASGTPKLVTQKREVRFFSLPRGAAKLCNFSRSPFAADVLDRLFDLHEASLTGKLPTPHKPIISDAALQHIDTLPACTTTRADAIRKLASERGVSEAVINRQIKKAKNGEPANKNLPGHKRYIQKHNKGNYDKVMKLH